MKARLLRAMALSIMVAIVVPLAQPAGAVTIGHGEGCTPGYWKNHPGAWEENKPSDTLGSEFTFPAELSGLESKTFMQALKFGGGTTVLDAAKLLMKAAVASFLNAANDDIKFPYRRYGNPFDIQQKVNEALASLDRETMLELKDHLDGLNNEGCPL